MDQRSALWRSGQDEAVSVNQRSLIDKVLARYSGELTIFRELLQNADDAGARSVQIRFCSKDGAQREDRKAVTPSNQDGETEGPGERGMKKQGAVPDFAKQEVVRYVLLNDGTPFRPEDWSRLKKIADGNPDESKIGAFGVGFYSLFSVTEEPLVESGGTWMGFHWKGGGDQLFARSGALPPSTTPPPQSHFGLPLTSFTMDLRTPSPLPATPLELARFLATSITFMQSLERAELFFDDVRLVLVEKDMGTMKRIEVPTGVTRASEGGLMRVEGLESTDVRIKAEIVRLVYTNSSPPSPPPKPIRTAPQPTSSLVSMLSGAFFSRGNSTPPPAPTPPPPPPPAKDPYELLPTSLSLRVIAADVVVTVGRALSVELERATKKQPPKRTKVGLVFTGREEWERGEEELKGEAATAGSVWRGLRADLEGTGLAKIFIGHATGQTTGIGGHISARFIPTVERESIDLVDRSVSIWNKELLFVSGILARSIYELELAEVKMLWQGTTPDAQPSEELRAWLTGRALHALRFFSYFPSTPSAIVSRQMEAAFFSSKAQLAIVSSQGVFDASHKVRMPHDALTKFIKNVPIVPKQLLSEASVMVHRLREMGMIKDMTLGDVFEELKSRVLSEEEMVECLRWWITLSTEPSFEPSLRSKLLDVAVYSIKSSNPTSSDFERIIPLSDIRSYYDQRRSNIPADVPLPPDTLPFSLSKTLQSEKLPHALGFTELLLHDWIKFLVSPALSGSLTSSPETDMLVSPVFSEKILAIVAKAWPSLNAQSQSSIFSTLSDKKIMPTRSGMVIPGEAYFPSVSLFPDLPILAFPKGTPIKGSMEKLLVALGVRRHVELQLVFTRLLGATGGWSVIDLVKYLSSVWSILSAAEISKLKETPAFPVSGSTTRHSPGELYEPTDELRKLKLPILDWGMKWRASSEEGRILAALGLRRNPPIDVLLPLAANTVDFPLQTAALDYFLSHFQEVYAASYQMQNIAFVPSIKPDGTAFLAPPSEVYTNPESAVLGFSVVSSSFRIEATTKLRIASDPPSALIVAKLTSEPPRTVESAKIAFDYLASRISHLSSADHRRLQLSSIVPVMNNGATRMMRPSEVYFVSEGQSSAMYKALFTYVDFGPKGNTFLRAIGVQAEPTVAEVAGMLVKDAGRVLTLAGTSDAYLDVLRNVANNLSRIPNSTRKEMVKAPLLLAHRRVKPVPTSKKALAVDEEDYEIVWELARAADILILDDPVVHLLFVEHILAAPEESTLEHFYLQLGSHRLSSRVTEDYRQQPPANVGSPLALATKGLVLERIPLFLHERSKGALSADALRRQLDVVEVRGLSLKRVLSIGGVNHSSSEPASAAVFKDKGRIRLVVSGAFDIDYYEVALALVKIVLSTPRAADALLLHTILSTPLSSLKRRGFNTDRILRAKKAERLAQEAARETAAREQRVEDEKLSGIVRDLEEMFPDADPSFIHNLVSRQDSDHLSKVTTALLERPYPPRHKPDLPTSTLSPSAPGPPPPPPHPESKSLVPVTTTPEASLSNSSLLSTTEKSNKISSKFNSALEKLRESATAAYNRPGGGGTTMEEAQRKQQSRQDDTGITPQSSVKHNVEQAINSSRRNNASSIQSEPQLEKVKEAGGGFCDQTGAKTNLAFVGEERVTKIQIYVDKSISSPKALVAELSAPISRFAKDILRPLGAVFKLDPKALHIFYDSTGPLIAFNRAGSIFVNLRYYRAWHDDAVQTMALREPLSSWYFSIAHELAHNLIQPHNSEFSYFFSAISETYLTALMELLADKA